MNKTIINAIFESIDSLILLFILHQLYQMNNTKDVQQYLSPLPTDVDEQLSMQEHVILRENRFDQRIDKIMQQLEDNGEQMHPSVKNLPHDIIDKKPIAISVEVAE